MLESVTRPFSASARPSSIERRAASSYTMSSHVTSSGRFSSNARACSFVVGVWLAIRGSRSVNGSNLLRKPRDHQRRIRRFRHARASGSCRDRVIDIRRSRGVFAPLIAVFVGCELDGFQHDVERVHLLAHVLSITRRRKDSRSRRVCRHAIKTGSASAHARDDGTEQDSTSLAGSRNDSAQLRE